MKLGNKYLSMYGAVTSKKDFTQDFKMKIHETLFLAEKAIDIATII
jgi:hypothetical protein